MTVTIPLPDNLDEALVRELDHAAREAVAARLYREGKLSHGQFAKFLNIGRGEVDEVLARHGIVDEFAADEVAAQVQASRSARRQANNP
jgi:predicted HTH domain antitoxin